MILHDAKSEFKLKDKYHVESNTWNCNSINV